LRIFPGDLEERAFRHGLLGDWKRTGLVDDATAGKIAADIGEPPARAAVALRVVLFGFAMVCIAAAFFLFARDSGGRASLAFYALAAAVACAGAGETIIAALKVYRYGAEEACVAAAVILAALALDRFFGADRMYRLDAQVFSAAILALGALAYLRYGYRLAFFGAVLALGFLIGAFDFGERPTRVLLACVYAGALVGLSLVRGLPRRETERLEIGRFFLALSVPLCLNLRLDRLAASYGSPQSVLVDAFAWATFAAIFIIPAVWIWWGAHSRSRSLLWAGGIGILVALCSVKPYTGAQRHSWDPAVLGVELVVAALLLKRWLDSGPGKRRGAYSSEELRGSEPGGLFGLLAGGVAGGTAAAPAGPAAPKGHGGGFGGGGASGSY
jgi:hypothetical protein